MVNTDASPWANKSPADLRRGDELGNADGQRVSMLVQPVACVVPTSRTRGDCVRSDEWYVFGRVALWRAPLHRHGLRPAHTLVGNQDPTLTSRENGIDVHLFQVHEEGVCAYEGRVELAGDVYPGQQPDADGKIRYRRWPSKRWRTDRQRKESIRLTNEEPRPVRSCDLNPPHRLQQLQALVSAISTSLNMARGRAAAVCELCDQPAPFTDRSGEPHLESHHIVWLARGGENSIANTVALCPSRSKKLRERALRCAFVAVSPFSWG